VSAPKSHFELAQDARRHLLLAGGIGVTPILSMARRLASVAAEFELHYCARSAARMAFRDDILSSPLAACAHFYVGEEGRRLDLQRLFNRVERETHVYACGPRRFIEAALGAARERGWPEARLHWEHFAGLAVHSRDDREFEVALARTRRIVRVEKGRTIVQALAAAGVRVPVSCEQGVCGTCITRVLDGEPDHRDSFFTAEERAANDQLTPCCSRAKSARLVLDL
jgi:vanillate O-demethylase ferredoxin subunit